MPISTNRTYWPINGGAVAFQPGWNTGHSTAFIYVNMGLGTLPPNYSHPVVPVFQVVGPTNEEYPDKTVCLPQVPLPPNISVQPGDNATIQIVEAAKHGAGLFSVSGSAIQEQSQQYLLRHIANNLVRITVRRHHIHRRHVPRRRSQRNELLQLYGPWLQPRLRDR